MKPFLLQSDADTEPWPKVLWADCDETDAQARWCSKVLTCCLMRLLSFCYKSQQWEDCDTSAFAGVSWSAVLTGRTKSGALSLPAAHEGLWMFGNQPFNSRSAASFSRRCVTAASRRSLPWEVERSSSSIIRTTEQSVLLHRCHFFHRIEKSLIVGENRRSSASQVTGQFAADAMVPKVLSGSCGCGRELPGPAPTSEH